MVIYNPILFSYCFVECTGMDNILQVDSVEKSFGDQKLLSDIYLGCKTGQVVAVIGRNGSGKSTLFKIITGLEKSVHSFVSINDRPINSSSTISKFINYLPQHHFLPNQIRVKTILKLVNCNRLFNHKLIQPFLNNKPKDLSGGQLRLIEVLITIYQPKAFTILDEPFNGLSPLVIDEICLSINEMKAHKGFILSDHRYEDVLKVSDRLFYLNNRHLKEIKSKKELKGLSYLPDYLTN
ncbi:ABC transporter ATP-binding protein [Nonlabens tegetincola]|uniref:ABC transporter ATP-binding protein n=2 Tax=Nonlabens tegetincola TaxID=323273 RepID=A0A090Q220_9FLAO|nr:ABC transporter ATP-binding protein [Nonlabens tegetincola]